MPPGARVLGPLALALFLVGGADARSQRAGTVLIRSGTTGAVVTIDGQEVGEIPMRLPLALRAGTHTVKLSRPGHGDFLDTFKLGPGQDLVLEIDLLPAAGILRAEASVPGAVVVVDGRALGEVPFEGELEPGKRVVEVRAPGHTVFREEMTIEAGAVYPVRAELIALPPAAPVAAVEPAPWYGRWWVWAGAAAVVAGGVATAVVLSEPAPAPTGPKHVVHIAPGR